MLAQIKSYTYAIISAIVLGIAAWLYGKGRRDANRKQEVEDYENAEDIRRRVSVDRSDRMRELDDAGWRDE